MSPAPRRSSFPGLQDLAGRRRELIEELVQARRDGELSQTEIAARMGTSQSAVARLESGELDARLSTLERYAAALGRTVDWRVRPSEESP
jgi:predicted transcriptional regulator